MWGECFKLAVVEFQKYHPRARLLCYNFHLIGGASCNPPSEASFPGAGGEQELKVSKAQAT